MMKKLGLFFLLSTTLAFAQTNKSINELTRLAQNQNKNIVLYFTGSDWCKPCMDLDKKILQTPEFSNFITKKVIFQKVDYRRVNFSQTDKNYFEELAKLFNPKKSFPKFIVINKNRKTLKTIGYNFMWTNKEYIQALNL
ncbi:MAG: thioredoxin family protein [Flavobacteriales bacterium]|jgi:thioredoxin-related protein|nr:thioredoxin family protein [Flavobacteriales bacterium]